jgi:hypothetical protein
MFAAMFMSILMVIVAVFSKPSVVFVTMLESVSLRPVIFTMVPNSMSVGLVIITKVLNCTPFRPVGRKMAVMMFGVVMPFMPVGPVSIVRRTPV